VTTAIALWFVFWAVLGANEAQELTDDEPGPVA